MQKVPHCKKCMYYIHGKWGSDTKYTHWCLHFERANRTNLLNQEVQTSPKNCPIRVRMGKSPMERAKEVFAMPETEKIRPYTRKK